MRGWRMQYAAGCAWIVWGAVLLALSGCAEKKTTRHWLGINTSMGADPGARATLAVRSESDLRFVRELGFPRLRDPVMNWDRIQSMPGEPYDFSVSDTIVLQANAADIELHAVLADLPPWATHETDGDFPVPEHEQAFSDFVTAFVERYDGDGKADMPKLSEPIHAYEYLDGTGTQPPDEYAAWLRRFYDAVHAADPEAIVVLGSLRSPGLPPVPRIDGHDADWFGRLLDASVLEGSSYPCFDVVGFHNNPEDYPGRQPFSYAVTYIQQTMADVGIDKPLWLTAYGYDSAAREEVVQADKLVQWTLTARALGIARAYVYCLHDESVPDAIGPRRNYGLLRVSADNQTPTRKPAYSAMRQVLAELDRRPRVTRRADGLYVLAGRGSPTYVVWKPESQYDPSGVFMPGWWEVRRQGGPADVQLGSEIEITETPVFLRRALSPFLH